MKRNERESKQTKDKKVKTVRECELSTFMLSHCFLWTHVLISSSLFSLTHCSAERGFTHRPGLSHCIGLEDRQMAVMRKPWV